MRRVELLLDNQWLFYCKFLREYDLKHLIGVVFEVFPSRVDEEGGIAWEREIEPGIHEA